MRAISRLVVVAAMLIGFAPAATSAQPWTADVGINGGGSWYSESLSDEMAGPEGARFRAGWLLGSQITFWPGSRFGLRANGTYTERPLGLDGEDDVAGIEDGHIHGNINLWSGSIDALIRLKTPNESWMGAETLPYIALGAGMKWVNPAHDYEVCNVAGQAEHCATVYPPTGPIAVGEESVPMGLIGLGADFRLSPRSALRLEINDRIYKPQMYRAAPTGTFDADGMQVINLPNGDELVSTLTHEIGAQLGFHLLMGLREPPVVVVAPAPAPTPAPTPAPAPAPAPVENPITVCVIDPTAPNGTRMQSALYRVEQRDTVVMQGANRVPLSQVAGNAMVARDADWYVRGQPLVLRIGAQNVEYLTYQGAMQIDANRVVYLGMVNGYPVYADRDEVADIMGALNTARQANPNADLGTLLAANRMLRDGVEDVEFMYVPLQRTGCVFQPMQMMQPVTKGKGK